MKNSFKKFISFLWAFFFTVSLFTLPIVAKELCTIRISADYGNKPVVGLELKAFLCAKMQDSGFEFTGDFNDYPISSMPENADAWNELAVSFEGFIYDNNITPVVIKSSDANGVIELGSLEPGLYFFSGSVLKNEDFVYTSSPFFVYVSASDPTVEATLKLSGERTPGYVVRKVVKIWNDNRDVKSRPAGITVILYEDGAEYERVELTQEMNWSYSWVLPDGHNWSICEVTPEGYFSETDFEGTTFTITNTPCTSPSTPPTPPFLPQTGLVRWPIIVFFGMGIVAFAIAVVLKFGFRRIEKDENN